MFHSKSYSSKMMHPSSPTPTEDNNEVEPLVPSTLPNYHRRGRQCYRSRCLVSCASIVVIVLFGCLFVGKEAIIDLKKSSSSFIRKKVDDALASRNFDLDDSDSNHTKSNPLNSNETVNVNVNSTEKDIDNNLSSDSSEKTNNGMNQNEEKKKQDEYIKIKDDEVKQNEETKVVRVKDNRKNLVLHVGPQKTGSTTLQNAWTVPQGLIGDLKRDNYRYAFINPHVGYFNCDVGTYGSYDNCQVAPRLENVFNTTRSNGENLLLSDENLDYRFVDPLREYIDSNYWDVTVIVVYRRIHEWLVSWYNQINKTTNRDIHGNILIDDHGHPYRMDHKWWPDQGGSEIPVFSDWYKKFTEYFDRSDLAKRHRSVELVNAYEPLFNKVVVHSMHQEGDLVTNFMCDSVPEATNCCNRLRKGALEIPLENASVNLDHDIIAVEARNRGMLQKRLSRPEVVAAVSTFIEKTNKEIPRKCDHEMIEEIRGWLLDSEKELFYENWTEDQTSELQQIYDVYLEKGKLCDVDLTKVFADEDWMDFFASLDNRPTLVLHIGPQKTGSTTLQNAWGAPLELGNLLREDRFSYAKITPQKEAFDCDFDGDEGFSNCKASTKLIDIISTATNNGMNLLLSDENLNEVYVDALREVIDDRDYKDVKVVLVYRRIYEWLFSWYNQLNKHTTKDRNGNLLLNEKGYLYSEEHQYFPEQGGVAVPPFSEWYKEFANRLIETGGNLTMEHPSIHFMNVYKPHFDNIQVFNMHQDGDFVTNFMCEMIPEAKKTCTELQKGTDVPQENSSVDLDHDIIAVNIYEGGYVRKDITRPLLKSAIAFFLDRTGKILPRKCDDVVIDQIRTWFYDSEQIMYPGTNDGAALEQLFDAYFAKGTLCDVDVEKILLDDEWLEFIDSLKHLDLSPSTILPL